jgi:acyl-CoA thioesterase II
VLYYVTNIRDGRSYCTRTVRAVQYGQTVFYMVCSFHVPEPGQPMQHWPMPHVVAPEEAQREEDFIMSLAQRPGISEKEREWYKNHAEVRRSDSRYR